MNELLIRGARRWGHDGVGDLRLRDGKIAEKRSYVKG